MFKHVMRRLHNALLYGADPNISPYVVLDNNVVIDRTAKVFHFCVIRENVRIGEGSVIGHNVVVERDTKIGKNTTIQSQCHITANAVIGDNVFIGPGVTTMNEKVIANNGRAVPKIEQLVIEDGARVGAGATIAPGVTIGANAFVKANSFVTKNIPAGEVWGCRNGFAKAVRLGDVPVEEYL